MTKPTYRFSCRSTLQGNSAWSGADIRNLEPNLGSVALPNDGSIVTTPITTQVSGVVHTTTDGKKQFKIDAVTSRNNASLTEAGNNPMLGGRGYSAGGFLQIFTNPGQYTVRAATGACDATVNTPTRITLLDGTYENLRPRWVGDIKPWSATMNLINGPNSVYSSIDGSFWNLTNVGTGNPGSDEPFGAGTPTLVYTGSNGWPVTEHRYVDNAGKVWKRVKYFDGVSLAALSYMRAYHHGRSIVGEIGPTAADPGVDDVAAASWGTRSVAVAVSGRYGNCLSLRIDGYWRQVEITEVAPVLADVKLFDQVNADVGVEPVFYCNEKAKLPLARIQRINGDAVFTLLGTHAAYYEIVTRNGTDPWIRSKLPIPDAQAGALDLTIRQTDLDADGSTTHDTVLSGTLLSSEGKPRIGRFTKMPTLQWLRRKVSMDLYDVKWAGAVGAADQTVQVNSVASFITAWNNQAPTVNGTTKYCIQLQDGDWSGAVSGLQTKDFANGWCRVENAPGHNPEIGRPIIPRARKLTVKGLRFTTDPALSGNTYQFRYDSPSPQQPINNVLGRWQMMTWEGCTFGAGFKAGLNLQTWASDSASGFWQAVFVGHAEYIGFYDCQFIGTRNALAIQNTHLLVIERCDGQWSKNDFLSVSQAGHGAIMGVFADDDMHVVFRNNSHRNEIDFAGFNNTAHTDWIQVLRQVNDNDWGPGVRAISGTSNWTNVVRNDVTPKRVYNITAGGGGYFGQTPPTGTTPGVPETNGDLTLEFAYEIPLNDIYIVFEDNDMNCDGPLRGVAARQCIIDSNELRGQKTIIMAFNNAMAGPNVIGLFSGSGEIHSCHNTMCAQASLSLLAEQFNDINPVDGKDDDNLPQDAPLNQACGTWDGKIYSTCDFTTSPAYVTYPDRGGAKFEDDANKYYRFVPSTTPNPNTILNGPYSQVTEGENIGYWHFPTLNDTGTNPREEFKRELRTFICGIEPDTEWGILRTFEVAPGAAASLELSKAQAQGLRALTEGADTVSGIGPVEFRWHRDPGDTGVIDGADITFDVV